MIQIHKRVLSTSQLMMVLLRIQSVRSSLLMCPYHTLTTLLPIDLNGLTGGIDFSTTYTEDDPPQLIVDPSMTLFDPDNQYLSSAEVRINNVQNGADEILTAITTTNVITSYTNGVLTITPSGVVSATISEFQTVLGSVRYANLSDAPNTTARSISFTVTDPFPASNSPTATSTVSVVAVNDAPILIDSIIITATQVVTSASITGDTISNILANSSSIPASGGDPISDSDGPSESEGIAVVGDTDGSGNWQYFNSTTTTWVNFPNPSGGQALLLWDSDRIRFVPGTTSPGTNVSLDFKAWDRSEHTRYTQENASSFNATGSFSDFTGTIITTIP